LKTRPIIYIPTPHGPTFTLGSSPSVIVLVKCPQTYCVRTTTYTGATKKNWGGKENEKKKNLKKKKKNFITSRQSRRNLLV
jgi:hypothetical protein